MIPNARPADEVRGPCPNCGTSWQRCLDRYLVPGPNRCCGPCLRREITHPPVSTDPAPEETP